MSSNGWTSGARGSLDTCVRKFLPRRHGEHGVKLFSYFFLRVLCASVVILAAVNATGQTDRPPLHGKRWVALTGKPLGAVAGAKMFERGGNAVDATCAMLAVVCTMHDDVGWGGETQALIYHPEQKKVIGICGLGVAPTGATPEFFKGKKLKYPPSEGPLAAVTPGNPGALMVMLAEFGTLSLKDVLEPAMQLAEGYPIEAELVAKIEKDQKKIKEWPYSNALLLTNSLKAGEIFRQRDLLDTLQKLVDAEAAALKFGKDRKQAIQAAYDRFYKGDIAKEWVRSCQEQGGLHTEEDLANWKVKIEEPVKTTYRGIEVYKLTHWTQGPALLQALNILEQFDLKSMSYNTARYIHLIYQAMSLAFADRDFYYGDPDFPPEEPIQILLSKEYAVGRAKTINLEKNDSRIGPGNPYALQGKEHPFKELLQNWPKTRTNAPPPQDQAAFDASFRAGTTSIQAADAKGWAVSVTPSGGWMPVCIAGRTGMGMSQRMQSFVLDEAENPFNVVAPGKRPRVTLTPTLALTNGRPFLCFSVQGGDTQDQNLLQFFLNVVEFGMTVQEACEAANITSYQMRSSFEKHESQPGRVTLNEEVPSWTRRELQRMGYKLDFQKKTSGPITAIYFDWEHGSFWAGVSDQGEDYGIVW
jgi:gamma-glutamyltranspeptidase / glutathione hydrolase